MRWNWEQSTWPYFVYNAQALVPVEHEFLRLAGELVGAYKHVDAADQTALKIELLSDEAVKTSAIEGEVLNRASVQSSLRMQFGLEPKMFATKTAEHGVSQMMVDRYVNYDRPLTDDTLFNWHKMLFLEDETLQKIGLYRTHNEAMQVVSGPLYKRKVHFEAPLSARVPEEMRQFMRWFNDTHSLQNKPLPALTRAALAHLYFVCIHPFEDGNGRISRAIAEKALAQTLGYPTLIALADTIERNRTAYYDALARNNQQLQIDDWMHYFAKTVIQAQRHTIQRVEFYIAKAKFYRTFQDRLNDRQLKVVARLFAAGIDGFKGGLSADNYMSISKTSRASATRDLQALVAMGALNKSGELRYTRYALNLS